MDIFDILDAIFDIIEAVFDLFWLHKDQQTYVRSEYEDGVKIRKSVIVFLIVLFSAAFIFMVFTFESIWYIGLSACTLIAFAFYYVIMHFIKYHDDEFEINLPFGKSYQYKYTDITELSLENNRLKFTLNDGMEFEFSYIFSNIDIFYNIAMQYQR